MRKSAQKALVLAIGVVVAVTLVAGCDEENRTNAKTDITKSRLVAVENRQLKKEIKQLKERHKKEIKHQERLLAKCQREKENIAELSGKGIKDLMDAALNDAAEQNSKLRRENEKLKNEIAQLKKQLEELKKQAVPKAPGG